jgi:hypothetical protein
LAFQNCNKCILNGHHAVIPCFLICKCSFTEIATISKLPYCDHPFLSSIREILFDDAKEFHALLNCHVQFLLHLIDKIVHFIRRNLVKIFKIYRDFLDTFNKDIFSCGQLIKLEEIILQSVLAFNPRLKLRVVITAFMIWNTNRDQTSDYHEKLFSLLIIFGDLLPFNIIF